MRADRRAGTIAAVHVNTWRDTKKEKDPYTWVDFFPEHRGETHRPQTEEEMAFAMELWARKTKIVARARGE